MLKLLEMSVDLMKLSSKDDGEELDVIQQQTGDDQTPQKVRGTLDHIQVKNIEKIVQYLKYNNDKAAEQKRRQIE